MELEMTAIRVHLPTILSKQIPTAMELVMLVITAHPLRILGKRIMMEISGEMFVTTVQMLQFTRLILVLCLVSELTFCTDGDNIGDGCDNCPVDANPNQEDTDGDYIGIRIPFS